MRSGGHLFVHRLQRSRGDIYENFTFVRSWIGKFRKARRLAGSMQHGGIHWAPPLDVTLDVHLWVFTSRYLPRFGGQQSICGLRSENVEKAEGKSAESIKDEAEQLARETLGDLDRLRNKPA